MASAPSDSRGPTRAPQEPWPLVSIDDERSAPTDVSHHRCLEAVVVDHGAEPLLDLPASYRRPGRSSGRARRVIAEVASRKIRDRPRLGWKPSAGVSCCLVQTRL